jgi:hypothetical protein
MKATVEPFTELDRYRRLMRAMREWLEKEHGVKFNDKGEIVG